MTTQEIVLVPGWNPFCVLVNDTRPLDEIFGGYSWFAALSHWNTAIQAWDNLGPGDPLVRGESYWVNYTGLEPTAITLYEQESESNWLPALALGGVAIVAVGAMLVR
jgi:hypothetical protein